MKFNKQLFILFSLISLSTFAQSNKKTLNYQAVILDPKAIDIPGASITGQPLNKGNVCLRFSLLNALGELDYEETQQATTDEYGLVSLAIGTGTQVSSSSIYRSFENIVWNTSMKSLKVSVSYDGCNSFKQVSTQTLNYTPYALYAEAVEYKNVREAPSKLSQFSNDAGYLIPKDLDPLKNDIQNNSIEISTNKISSDATFLLVNQNIISLGLEVADTKRLIKTINTTIVDQQNQIVDNRNQISSTASNLGNQLGGLQGQINVTNATVSNLTEASEIVSNKSAETDLGGANPSDQLYPSQKAAKSYVDNAIYNAVGTGVADATTLAPGKVQLSGDLAGTATNPTVPALANKENSSNKSTSVQTDASSDIKYPSVKAVKDYVDQATTGIALQATVDGKADKNSPTFTGTPVLPTETIGVTQSAADNSTRLATTAFVQQATAGIALQAAVDLKAPLASPAFTGTPSLPLGTTGVTQAANDNSTKLATTEFVTTSLAAGAPDATTIATGKVQLAGDLGGTASAPTVPGLALKANTSDVTNSLALKEDSSNKSNAALGSSSTLFPTQSAVKTYVDAQIASATISDADAVTKGKLQLAGDLGGTATAPTVPGLALKAPINNPTFTGTVGGITQSMVGLSNVDNTSDANKPVSTATQTALDLKADSSSVNAALALRMKTTDVNTALALKANTTDVTNSMALKAPINNPTFTGTVGGITQSMVGLSNVDNTSDANKPVSTATQTALDLKSPLASPTFTGTPSLPLGTTGITQAAGDNSTKLATTAFVKSAMQNNIAKLSTIQRDTIISSLVEGLTIWNTTNKQLEVYDGSYWRNMIGLLVSTLRVGDTYGGGKVFYIFDIGDNGYVKGQTHGLIAATEDQTTDAGIKWFPEKYYGATGTYIGLGLPNTLSIILSAVLTGTTNLKSFAAGLANSYRGGGYMDWYLPSKDELNLLYENRLAIGGFATTGHATYWSSTQKGSLNFTKFEDFAKGVTSARTQFFFTTTGPDGKAAGTQSDLGIDNPRRVRAIRIF